MRVLILDPLDTLFFRDGRPYNQDDPSEVEAASFFPPYPPTIVGAVRAALARAMGWRQGSPWPADTLGDGVDWQSGDAALGPLRFRGPFVRRCGKPIFPAPLNLVGGQDPNGKRIISHLAPSSDLLATDIGAIGMPVPVAVGSGFKTLEGSWLDADGMKRALNGLEPGHDSMIASSSVWQTEPRVGVARDANRRPLAEGGLYATAHARPARSVSLSVEAEGLPDVGLGGDVAPLGGEARGVWISRRDGDIDLPEAPALEPAEDGVLRYTVGLIIPADLGDDWPGPGGRLSAGGRVLPGRIVAACTGRAVMAGGWTAGRAVHCRCGPSFPRAACGFSKRWRATRKPRRCGTAGRSAAPPAGVSAAC
jgi:CRISPR-associated protein Cmr3